MYLDCCIFCYVIQVKVSKCQVQVFLKRRFHRTKVISVVKYCVWLMYNSLTSLEDSTWWGYVLFKQMAFKVCLSHEKSTSIRVSSWKSISTQYMDLSDHTGITTQARPASLWRFIQSQLPTTDGGQQGPCYLSLWSVSMQWLVCLIIFCN